jgi:N-acyl-D-amino-acid deacylase
MKSPDLDLLIRAGLIVDGSGQEPFIADVAIAGGRITHVGAVAATARSEIRADGKLVTPGFVDIHTHYDGQAIWSSYLSPSSNHGVTTVVVGNCGVGFAPCRAKDRDTLISVMEGVEDIPEIVMAKGLSWSWETFPEFLDALESRPHDIDIAAYLPHSPLRVHVMGERGALREAATPGDLASMRAVVRQAIEAGALGFATSRLFMHRTGGGSNIPSFDAGAAELTAILEEMRELGTGVFQLVMNTGDAVLPAELSLIRALARGSGRPVTFSLAQVNDAPDQWREILRHVSQTNASGGCISPQVFPRPVGVLLGHDISANPFSMCATYKALAHLPHAQKLEQLRRPEIRARLLTETPDEPGNPLLAIARDFTRIFPLTDPPNYEPAHDSNIAALASHRSLSPEEVAYDLMLRDDGHGLLYAALANYAQGSLDPVLEMLQHPHTIIGLGDGGAHYGLICDASYPTFVLTHWTRDRKGGRLSVPQAIRALCFEPANAVGLCDRGLIAPGYKADINIIDYEKLVLHAPYVVNDLPGGGHRLSQQAKGFAATIVSGVPIVRDDRRTDSLPGRLVRGPQPGPLPKST